MLVYPISSVILLCNTLPFTSGFQINGPTPISKSYSSSSTPLLHATTQHHNFNDNEDRIKSVGGGIPVVPPGNCLLFDPDEQGKLQGTGALTDRISQGSSYALQMNSIQGYLQAKAHTDHVQAIIDNDTTAAPLAASSLYSTTTTEAPPNAIIHQSQNWLEHLTPKQTSNFAKSSKPVTATILARERIISPDAPGDIQHIVLQLPEGMHYTEGQSLSIIPPGKDPKSKKGKKPYKSRLYSIASTRYGDALDGRTISLCVRRAEYHDPDTNAIDPSKAGACSNFLCDALPGSTVSVSGPVGKTMNLPEDLDTDVIMVATGTGIAPFRGFLHRLFVEETVSRHMFGGKAWLVLGVPVSGGVLYREELDSMLENAQPDQLQVDYAISREMTNTIDGGKLYVQHVITQNAAEFFKRLDNGAHVYFCGLKGMMPPIMDALKKVAEEEHGLDWGDKLKGWKDNHQWHVEVY